MEQQLLQLGIAGAALLIMFLLVKILIERTDKIINKEREASCKERDDFRNTLEKISGDFSKVMTNHIDHNTKAIEKNSRALDNNSEVLKKVLGRR